MIIGTIGHIDHGKTSLVKTLTGTDTDRLKEEKARGITIELGFAYWPQNDGSVIGFVDMPGHERLVHTMVAGAHGVDLVLLVIAADDGIMPQTREHIEIVEVLGRKQAVVALTKIDKVSAQRRSQAEAEVKRFLASTAFAASPVIPVSVVSGEGLQELRGGLLAGSSQPSAPPLVPHGFRLAVDRSFVLAGAGVIVTGMALAGEIGLEERVIVSPGGLEARVRSIHAQNRRCEKARAGDRCALNLVGPQIRRDRILRGDMVLSPALHAPTRHIDAQTIVTPAAKHGLRPWMPVRLLTGTSDTAAHLVLLSDDPPQPGRSVRIQIVTEKPVAVINGDGFLLRDPSASHTLGGGRFLDVRAPDRKRRTAERRAYLDAMSFNDDAQAFRRLMTTTVQPIAVGRFLRDRGALPDKAAFMAKAVNAVTVAVEDEIYALSEDNVLQLDDKILAGLSEHHAALPDDAGLGLEALRLRCAKWIAAPVFRAFLMRLLARGALAQDRSWFRLPGHSLALSSADKLMWAEIEPTLLGPSRNRPPRVRDLSKLFTWKEEEVRRILKRLARGGQVHEVAHDHFFASSVLSCLFAEMAALCGEANDWFSAAEFRDRLEAMPVEPVGRKVTIQILEFFDRHGVTIRRGDRRRINHHRRELFAPEPEG